MKRVLPIILVLVLVIVGATVLYPMLRERTGDPEIDLDMGGAAVAVVTTEDDTATKADETTTVEETTTEEAKPDPGSTDSDETSEETPTTTPEPDASTDHTHESTAPGTDSSQATNPTTTPAPESLIAPDFKVYDFEGNAVQYASLVDKKPVLLNFWASWCPPCREEMPDLQKLHDELGDEIEFILINSTDGVRETPAKAKAFLDENDFDMPVYLDQDGEASTIYGVRALPSNILIGADGNIIGGIPGALTEEQFRELFKTYLDIA